MNTFKAIPTVNNDISQTNAFDLTAIQIDINSPAEIVVNDLQYIFAQMILPDTSIDEALIIMQRSNNKSKLYVGTNTELLGVIDHFTLVSRNVLMIANRKGILRKELTVADIMNLAVTMPVLRKDNVKQSRVGDLLFTMQKLGEAHIKIVDENRCFCGLVSAMDISRALDRPVEINVTAHSFKDCFAVIHEHTDLI
jgi:DeoR family transcriptional regulator, catabolite repression regulator